MEDVVKSDVYSISLNSLIFGNAPKTIPLLSKLLEDSGYYGRFKIQQITSPNYKDIFINIEVYLPDSVYSYLWPFKTHFNLTTQSFGKRRSPIILKNSFKLIKCMSFFVNCDINMSEGVERVSVFGNALMGWATKEEYMKMILFLIKAGLFRNGKFVIKTDEDAIEIHANLFDYTYFKLDF